MEHERRQAERGWLEEILREARDARGEMARFLKEQDQRYKNVVKAISLMAALLVAVAAVDFFIVRGEKNDEDIERARAVYAGCLYRNDIFAEVRAFLDSVDQPSGGRFQMEPDCRTYTRVILDGVPKEAFDIPEQVDPRRNDP
jgi:hypothetical protein